jgi:hypothetical protein
MTPRHYMAPDCIGVCGMAVAEHASGMIGWGATQQERDGTKDAQARGTGKVPSFKGRKAYLSRTAPQEEPSRIGDFQEAAYVGRTSHGPTLRTQVHMWHMCMRG